MLVCLLFSLSTGYLQKFQQISSLLLKLFLVSNLITHFSKFLVVLVILTYILTILTSFLSGPPSVFFLVIALLIMGIAVLVLLIGFMLLNQSHSMKMTFLTLRCLLNLILHINLLSTSSIVHHMCHFIILRFLHLLLIYLLHLLNAIFFLLPICLILLLQLLPILQWLLPCLSLMLYLTMCALVFLILQQVLLHYTPVLLLALQFLLLTTQFPHLAHMLFSLLLLLCLSLSSTLLPIFILCRQCLKASNSPLVFNKLQNYLTGKQ